MNIMIECQRCGKGKIINANTYGRMIPRASVERSLVADGWSMIRSIDEILEDGQEVYNEFWRCPEHPMTADEFKGNPDD